MLTPKTAAVTCLMILSFMLNAGCGLLDNKDQWIEQVVELGNKERSQVVSPDGIFGDYRVFREGDSDVVVFEYKLKPNMQLTNKDQIKKDILGLLVGDESGEPQKVLEAGIVFTFVYLDSEGGENLRYVVTKEDL